MNDIRKLDKRESLRVVTDNEVIVSDELSKLSLNARKLLYIAISQCQLHDKEFYEYETTPTELAEMWGISRTNVYREARRITDELMQILIHKEQGKGFKTRHVFDTCDYDDDSKLKFKLHKEMTDLLLGLSGNFSKPLVWDFMRMKSTYSMAIWHCMQKEMKSFKPMMSAPMEFEMSLDELRAVTGTQNKLKQIGQFKQRVLEPAIKEIRTNCWVDISYTDIKDGRFIVGFRFTAKNMMGSINLDDLSYRQQKQVRKAMLVKKRADGTISPREYDELQSLILELDQITIEDYMNGYPE